MTEITGRERAEQRAAARAANPQLTVFDTGEMLEPMLHRDGEGRPAGPVDFDDDEGHTVLTVFAHPGQLESDDDSTTVVTIDWEGPGKLRINLNDGEVATFDEDGARLNESAELPVGADLLREAGNILWSSDNGGFAGRPSEVRRILRKLIATLEGAAK